MPTETIKLLIRHGLTIAGTLLLAKGVTTEADWQNTTNLITDAAGGLMMASSAVWSVIKMARRKKLEAQVAAQTIKPNP